jgi:fatty acid desaturase
MRASSPRRDAGQALRAALRRAMPPGAFEPQPLRGVVGLATVPAMVGLGWLVVCGDLPLAANLLLSLVLGQLFVVVGFAAHEALHHSVFRARLLEDVLGWIGFAPFLVTPGTWRAWHVQAHHAAPNVPDLDPDAMGTLEELRSSRLARWVHAVTPGSRHWASTVSLAFLFTLQGQLFLWHYSGQPRFRKLRFARRKERAYTLALAAGWAALAWALGPRAALHLILLPMIVGNATLMAYIVTNHWLRPRHPKPDDPFVNTMSVKTHPLVDLLHLNFSYHQEHHIFPSMSPRFAPRLRQELRGLDPSASVVVPHGRALRGVFRTPALYLDAATLVSADGTRRVDLATLEP